MHAEIPMSSLARKASVQTLAPWMTFAGAKKETRAPKTVRSSWIL